jgi:predicted DNA-binding transcriptional regulator YafY
VQSSRFITAEKSKELIDKLKGFAGADSARELDRQVVVEDRVKTENMATLYIVDSIHRAINQKCQLSFKYFDYDYKHKRKFRSDKENPENQKYYVVNPIATVFSNDNYYLFCYDDKHGNVAQYRVDRMTDVSVLLSDITPNEEVARFDISAYKKQLFGMYGGEETEVEFVLDNTREIIDVVFDKFGSNVKMYPVGDKLGFKSKVRVSPTFIAWCVSFGNKIKLVAPQKTVEEVADYIESLSKMYQKS